MYFERYVATLLADSVTGFLLAPEILNCRHAFLLPFLVHLFVLLLHFLQRELVFWPTNGATL